MNSVLGPKSYLKIHLFCPRVRVSEHACQVFKWHHSTRYPTGFFGVRGNLPATRTGKLFVTWVAVVPVPGNGVS